MVKTPSRFRWGAYVDGQYFYQSKTITIVDEHTGGAATCKDKAVCEVCGESYGELDGHNHVGGTVLVGEKSVTCTENGNTGDTCCSGCNAILAAGKVIFAMGHKGGTATCTEQAVCEVCGEKYGEPDADNHTKLTHVAEKAATKTAEGNIEYWYCEGCGKYFADRDGTEEITKEDTVTAKLTEEETEETTETTPPSPATGDAGNLALWIALLSAGCGVAAATAIVSKKRKYNR